MDRASLTMSDYPTASYISEYPEVYDNPNLTTWAEAGMLIPFAVKGFKGLMKPHRLYVPEEPVERCMLELE